jgi:hypothetical protein
MSELAEQTRLLDFHQFDYDVIEQIAEVAEWQRGWTWNAISSRIPAVKRFQPKVGNQIDVLDIIPKDDFSETYVYHMPMSIPLDENMMMRLATLSAVNPDKRIIASGNPGPPGQNSGLLKPVELKEVWNGYLRPTVEPILQYLTSQGLNQTVQIGYSYGADKAAASSMYAADHDQEVDQGVFMEPASVKERSLVKLTADFFSSGSPLEGYVNGADCNALI